MSNNNTTNMVPSLAEMTSDIYELVTAQPPKILSGIPELDDCVYSFAGKYVSVGGPAGSGKTDILAAITRTNLCAGLPVLFSSLELGVSPMVRRLVSCASNEIHPGEDITLEDFANAANLDSAKAIALHDGVAAVEATKHHFYLFDGCGKGNGSGNLGHRYVERVASSARAIMRHYGMPCVVICDYFQLLTTESKTGTSTESYDHVSARLAELAHTTGCAVIVATSLNKDGSIRGTNQLTYDCDVVINLSIDKDDLDDEDISHLTVRPMLLNIKKNRDGVAGGAVKVRYRPASHRYYGCD